MTSSRCACSATVCRQCSSTVVLPIVAAACRNHIQYTMRVAGCDWLSTSSNPSASTHYECCFVRSFALAACCMTTPSPDIVMLTCCCRTPIRSSKQRFVMRPLTAQQQKHHWQPCRTNTASSSRRLLSLQPKSMNWKKPHAACTTRSRS